MSNIRSIQFMISGLILFIISFLVCRNIIISRTILILAGGSFITSFIIGLYTIYEYRKLDIGIISTIILDILFIFITICIGLMLYYGKFD